MGTQKASDETFLQRVEAITHSLLGMRRNQSKADASFLASLGTLNAQQLNVLNIIGDNQPCPMSVIAYTTALPFSNTTVVVDQLVRKSLVQRERDTKDRRVIYAKLTENGMALYVKQIEHLKIAVALVLGSLSIEEQEILAKFMARFAKTMNGNRE